MFIVYLQNITSILINQIIIKPRGSFKDQYIRAKYSLIVLYKFIIIII